MKPFNKNHDSFTGGPLRLIIVGPPGTGKTRTALDAFLLEALERGVLPEEILCCSYSVAAATELRQRAAKATGIAEGALRATCSTIHSEALRRIKTVRGDWQLYDGITKKAKPLSKSQYDASSGLDAFAKPDQVRVMSMRAWDYCRMLMIDKDDTAVREICTRETMGSNAKRGVDSEGLFLDIKRYEKEKREGDAYIDFTDMLNRAIRTGGRRLKLLLIDEAQDCSPLQWELLKTWERVAEKVVIIGDPDQAVHEWMGAAPNMLLDRIRSNEWETRFLDQSYRVPVSVHAAARHIILKNQDRIDAPYEPAEHIGSVVNVGDTRESVLYLQKRIVEGGSGFVLSRSGRGLSPFIQELQAAGVPFKNERGASPWNFATKIEIAFAVISLKERGWADASSIRRMISSLPVRGTQFFNKGFARTKIIAAIEGDDETPFEMKDIEGVNWDYTLGGTTLEALERVTKSEKTAAAYYMAYKNFGIDAFIDAPRVVLTTMHASKGREADVVILSSLKPYPAVLAYENGQAEAERRVLYVGVTRAKNTLCICDPVGGNEYEELAEALAVGSGEAYSRSTGDEEVPF